MTNNLINRAIFDAIPFKNLDDILSSLIKGSICEKTPNDLFWIVVTDALNTLSPKQVTSLGFVSVGLSTPVNLEMRVVECQLRVAQANDIGHCLLNDLESLLVNNNTKLNAAMVISPNLAAIFLLSTKLLKTLNVLSSGKLIICFYVNLGSDSEQMTIENENIYWSETYIRNSLHRSGFKRIKRIDYCNNTESWAQEDGSFTYINNEPNLFSPSWEESSKLTMILYICDLGFSNVN